ncbi:MAG TPA: hypothetical protein VHB79_04565 [Polyangiaceae bacterium]|nr:hypothetical protein [Polyangiaceae bacterium]
MRTSIWIAAALSSWVCCACSASGKGAPVTSTDRGGPGGGGTGSGGSGNAGSGTSINVPDLMVPETPPDIVDSDPSNPNITHPKCSAATCTDFPAEPILGEGVPANAAQLFGAAADFTPGGLCVLEPQLSADGKPGAMLPANWVRPRFRVAAPAGIDLLEIRLHSPVEKNDLVAYTLYKAGGTAPSWYLPKAIWAGAGGDMVPLAGNGFANNAAGQPVTVTIRGINSAAPGKPVGVTGDFNIAPVVATGSMVFWTVNSASVTPESSKLLGFAVGDEGVAESLTLPQIKWTGELGEDGAVLRGYYDKTPLAGFVNGQVRCIGCHTSLPDGSGVVFTDDWPWSKAAASLAQGSVGAVPAMIGSGAQAIMKMPWWGTQTLSPGHWMAGDHTLVTTYGATFKSGAARTKAWQSLPTYDAANPANDDKVKWHQLAWIDLESTTPIDVAVTGTPDYGTTLNARNAAAMAAQGTAWGVIATGDTGVSAASPSFNHKGDKIVYVTTDYSPDGHPDATAKTADLHTVDYNNRLGGISVALPGASDPAQLEYYPAYSADDRLLTFTRAPAPSAQSPDGPYYNRFGQVMVIPAAGGTAQPLAANEPVSCGGDNVSAGIINSWPKWSPDAFSVNGKTYYFLIFSSARKYGDEFSQPFKLPANPLSAFKGLNDSSQLYLAAVVLDEATQQITTYPAVYIWNQNRAPGADGAAGLHYSNLTPAWDPIKLPPLEIPEVRNEPPK